MFYSIYLFLFIYFQSLACYNDDSDNDTVSTLTTLVTNMVFADDTGSEMEGDPTCDYPPIESSDDDTREFIPGELKIHLGKNLFAVAKKSHSNVDIRHHFFTDAATKALHPTRRGVNLTSYEFKKLVKFLPTLEQIWHGLKDLPECSTTHDDVEELRECTHCTPRPPQPKKRPEIQPHGDAPAVKIAVKRTRGEGNVTQESQGSTRAGDGKSGEDGDTVDLTHSRKIMKTQK